MMGREGRMERTWGTDTTHERIAFILVAFALTAFGALMIYSASSIMALTSESTNHDPAFYLTHQLRNVAVGLVLAVVVALSDYHLWSDRLLYVVVGVAAAALAYVIVRGQDAYGATRWISLGFISVQPSEFAKVALLLAAANLIQRFSEGDFDLTEFAWRMALMVGLPLLLVLKQPDKGSVLIVGVTIVAMLFLAGAPGKLIGGIALAGAVAIALLALKDDYSRSRILIMSDPWQDPYGDGYQLIQGYYAFGSGGLLGVGLGSSRQKYSYLPMAHNDFVYAVIGEELGLAGTLAVLVAFAALVWLGLRIARSAPDLEGRLIAAGGVFMLAAQLLVNVCGVLGMIPLSGKPIPFISYGGSSIMATLLLVGFVVSVSRSSASAAASGGFTVYEGASQGLRVIEGGASESPRGRVTVGPGGRRRIALGPSASDRLRGRDASRGGRG